ncbi:hypothetical protein BZM27_36265 [Paraburkholderia steynii]|uniref:IclR family transcriptional regulator n=1 Tax=Paraburkholderia steynii TaxID=1245441 RepID=A0A4V2NGI7_9BURK|nr:hypothetical protein BZM27_36265 [Paraburkholderia steynii]
MAGEGDDQWTDADKNGIQVVSRAAAILRALGRHPEGLSLGAIAEATALPRSTVQRLVGALEVEEFVESLGPRGGTRLGPALGQLARAAHGDIVSVARPHLETLSKSVGETVVLAGAAGRRAIVVDRIVYERELCIMVPIGASAAPYTTSFGKALLAQLPDDAVRKTLGDKVEPQTKRSVKTVSALLRQLSDIRKNGFAYDLEEHIEGLCSIATSIETFLGPYAVSIAAPVHRYEESAMRYAEELAKCKRAIETEVGRADG